MAKAANINITRMIERELFNGLPPQRGKFSVNSSVNLFIFSIRALLTNATDDVTKMKAVIEHRTGSNLIPHFIVQPKPDESCKCYTHSTTERNPFYVIYSFFLNE